MFDMSDKAKRYNHLHPDCTCVHKPGHPCDSSCRYHGIPEGANAGHYRWDQDAFAWVPVTPPQPKPAQDTPATSISPSLPERIREATALWDKALSPAGTMQDMALFAGRARDLIDEMAGVIEQLTRPPLRGELTEQEGGPANERIAELTLLERELSAGYTGKHEVQA